MQLARQTLDHCRTNLSFLLILGKNQGKNAVHGLIAVMRRNARIDICEQESLQSEFTWGCTAQARTTPMSARCTGGYVVPPDFYNQVLAIAAEQNTFRQYAFVQPMASATLQFPFLDITTVQSAGVSPFFGGVQAYWTAEAQTRTETEPQFKMMELLG
jgi:HK97 family phage major capsid protein